MGGWQELPLSPCSNGLQSSSCTLNLSSLILFLNFFLKKRKDDLQCRVSVRCMPQGIRFTYTWKYIFLPFQILFPYRLIENTEYSSLWSTVSPCCSCTFIFIYLFIFKSLFIWLCWVLLVACSVSVAACGILFPDQGSNPGPLHWELWVLSTGPPGKSPVHVHLYVVYTELFHQEIPHLILKQRRHPWADECKR